MTLKEGSNFLRDFLEALEENLTRVLNRVEVERCPWCDGMTRYTDTHGAWCANDACRSNMPDYVWLEYVTEGACST